MFLIALPLAGLAAELAELLGSVDSPWVACPRHP